MLNIRNKDIEVNEYYLKNYVNLSLSEKELVLLHRNINKKWMLQQDEISLENHLKWIENLKNDKTKLNYLVFKDNEPFIAISYHDIKNNEAFWGYFLINQSYKSEVLKIEKMIIDFAFQELKLDRLFCINDSKNHVIKIHEFFKFKEFERKIVNNQEYVVMVLEKEHK